ncbi:MAG: N-acetyltransferase [Salinibacterium sp.]|nr:MAG: N-acetyltransferase [Salinibacterium sp.]
MRIRSLTEDDIPKLAAIVAENYDAHCAQMFYPDARCALSDGPWRPRFLVATVDDEPVGCSCWSVDWSSWGVFNICWVQVEKCHQGRGIGKDLIDATLAELRPQATLILLSTSLKGYYERWGFEPLCNYRSAYVYDGSEQETLMALRSTAARDAAGQ